MPLRRDIREGSCNSFIGLHLPQRAMILVFPRHPMVVEITTWVMMCSKNAPDDAEGPGQVFLLARSNKIRFENQDSRSSSALDYTTFIPKLSHSFKISRFFSVELAGSSAEAHSAPSRGSQARLGHRTLHVQIPYEPALNRSRTLPILAKKVFILDSAVFDRQQLIG